MRRGKGVQKDRGSIANWIKDHPLVLILGAIAAVIGAAQAAFDVYEKSGLKFWFCQSENYEHAGGSFRKQGDIWLEYPPYDGSNYFRFTEVDVRGGFILLRNETPRADNQLLILRIPVCGGTVQWSHQNPLQWTDLMQAWPKR